MKYSFPSVSSNYQVFEPVEKVYEVDILNHWLQLNPGSILYTINNKIINIVRVGEVNKHDGPDIMNAILMIDGKLIIGDIEIHLKESDWFRHKHDSNPNYENVILHVVRNSDLTDNKLNIPTVELKGMYTELLDCTLTNFNRNINLLDILSHYSFERWQKKVERFNGLHESFFLLQKEIIIKTFEILGAGGNKQQFIKLASSLDFNILSNFNVDGIEQYLLGLSNELNIQWNRKGIRPNQQPQNRMKLAAEILRDIVIGEYYKLKNVIEIKNAFISNYHSAKGKGIQTELLGNVLYPFNASRALFNNQNELYADYFEEWKKLKLPYSYNKYSKRFKNILSNSELKYFYILHGLIEIDSKWCNDQICNLCPLKENYGNI